MEQFTHDQVYRFGQWLNQALSYGQPYNSYNTGGNPDAVYNDRMYGRRDRQFAKEQKEILDFTKQYWQKQFENNDKLSDSSIEEYNKLMRSDLKNNQQYQAIERNRHWNAIFSNATSFFSQLLHDTKDLYVSLRTYEFNLYDKLIEQTSQLITKKINIGTQYYTNSLDVVTATLNGNIMELGSQATAHQISLAKNIWEYERDYGLAIREMQNSASVAEQKFVIGPQADFVLNTARNIGNTWLNYRNENQRHRNAQDLVDEEISDEGKKQLQDLYEFAMKEKKEVEGLIDLREKALNLDVNLQKKLFEFQKQLFEQSQQIFQKVEEIAKVTDKNLMELDKTSKEFAKQFGFVGAQGQAWTKTMIDNNVIASKWAMKAEDFIRAQEAYFDNSGRAVNFNQAGGEDFNQMAALSRATGTDMKQIGALMGDMNIFNTSVGHGVDNIITMYKMANKMGLSGRKFIKDLSQNLKLAQKYNFVGGTKAMEKMSVWSQQVRLNLQTVANFAEGIMDGGLESTLEKAAKLQVLGGNAAIYSDPLGMMYDAGADVGNLARRIEGMLGNYGTFNSKTGETMFTWTDDMMVRQIAKSLGMDPEEAKNILREKNKFSVARKQIDRNMFSEEEQREISNRATYNEKTGQFEVTMLGGEKKAISDLTTADLENIKSNSDSEVLTQYAEKSLTVEQNLLSKTSYIAARIAQITGDTWYAAKERQEAIIKSHTAEQIQIGSHYNGEVWNFENTNLDRDYSQVYKNFQSGTLDNALYQMKSYTAAAAAEVDNFGKELAQATELMKNNDLQGLLQMIGAFAEATGSENLVRVADKAIVNYGRSKNGDKVADGDVSGLMGGWNASEAEVNSYGGRAQRFVKPTLFTAAHGYNDERSWVIHENNTSAVNSLTQAINNLSSVQIKSNADVKLNGSINLNGTNMKIDADQLARDPQFMQELVSLISQRIDLNRNGGKASGTQPGVVR